MEVLILRFRSGQNIWTVCNLQNSHLLSKRLPHISFFMKQDRKIERRHGCH